MSETQTEDLLTSEAERKIFLGHMSFRFCMALWTIYSVSTEPIAKGLISIGYLLATLWVSKGILYYQIGWARFRDRQEKQRQKEEAAEAKRQAAAEALKKKQQESAEKYFELAEA